MAQTDTAHQLEALLFALGRPLSRAELITYIGVSAQEIEEGIGSLSRARSGEGVVLVDDGKEVSLRAAGAAAGMVEKARKDDYTQSIGKAGMETLAAVLYRGPLTRAEVDFIRGVNSSQTLRTLAMRGLLRRVPNPRDERSYLYEPTVELLATLGVGRAAELPEYDDVKAKLAQLEEAYRAQSPAPHDE